MPTPKAPISHSARAKLAKEVAEKKREAARRKANFTDAASAARGGTKYGKKVKVSPTDDGRLELLSQEALRAEESKKILKKKRSK